MVFKLDKPEVDEAQVKRARVGLAMFLPTVMIGSGILEATMLATGKPVGEQSGLVLALMWMPALAALIARVVLREGTRDISLRWGSRRTAWACLACILWPIVVGALAYAPAWATGLVEFTAPKMKA